MGAHCSGHRKGQKDRQTGELWVVFEENMEGLIILSFQGVIAKLHEDRKAGLLKVPRLMRGRSVVMNDGSVAHKVVTFIEVAEQIFNASHAVVCPFLTVRMYCFIFSTLTIFQCNCLATTY